MKQKIKSQKVTWYGIEILCHYTGDNTDPEMQSIELVTATDLLEFAEAMSANRNGIDQIENLMVESLQDNAESLKEFFSQNN